MITATHRTPAAAAWLALLATLTGCATAPGTSATATAEAARTEEDKVVCVRESPTASKLLQTRCYTLRSLEERTRADREAADRIQTRPNDRAAGGG
jgi:hypothetical protein